MRAPPEKPWMPAQLISGGLSLVPLTIHVLLSWKLHRICGGGLPPDFRLPVDAALVRDGWSVAVAPPAIWILLRYFAVGNRSPRTKRWLMVVGTIVLVGFVIVAGRAWLAGMWWLRAECD